MFFNNFYKRSRNFIVILLNKKYSYLLLSSFIDSKITSFIIVLLLSCADFWIVKNLTGRYLVGMRWWTEIKDDGKEVWSYESAPADYQPNGIDSTFFWFG